MICKNSTPENRATVLFDGQCGLCRSSATMLARVDAGLHFDFVSLHDAQAGRLLLSRSSDAMMREMHLVDTDGSIYSGAEAVRIICARVPFLWWSLPYLYLPGSLPLWRKLYAALATRRFAMSKRFGCVDGACAVHIAT